MIIFSKRDVITHPLTIALIKKWSAEETVNYYTMYSELAVENCNVNTLMSKKYLEHSTLKRYVLTVVFYVKMIFKILTKYKKQKIYFPFSNGVIVDKILKNIKKDNFFIFHSFEYNKSNLRASEFADLVLHPEKTRMKLASFELPDKNHFYFPNVTDIPKLIKYPEIELINTFSKGRVKLFYQGLINVERRCLREILEALYEIKHTHCLIIMPGHYTNKKEKDLLDSIIKTLALEDSVLFVPSMKAPNHLSVINYIDIGIGLYKPTSINQYFAAPNRVFEINYFKKPLILPNNVGLKLYEYEYKGEIFCCNPYSKNNIIEVIKNVSTNKTETNNLTNTIGNFSNYYNDLSLEIKSLNIN